MRPLLAGLAITVCAATSSAQSDSAIAPARLVRVNDSVRVWSAATSLKGQHGSVSRIGRDSLAFSSVSGIRKIPQSFAMDLQSVDRLDVLWPNHPTVAKVAKSSAKAGIAGVVVACAGHELARFLVNNQFGKGATHDQKGGNQFVPPLSPIWYVSGAATGVVVGAVAAIFPSTEWKRVK
jgi:hypothetical protein